MKWLTISELRRKLNLPETTVRRYIQEYGAYIQQKKQGHMIVVAPDSVEVIREIRKCHIDHGMTKEQGEEYLANRHTMSLVIAQDDKEKGVTVAEVLDDMQKMKKLISKLVEENMKLRNELEQRDRKLEEKIESIHQLLESSQNQEKKTWWKWFK